MTTLKLIVLIAAIGATPERLTLPEVCELYQSGLYDLHDFGEWAADYKRTTVPIGWLRLNGKDLIPFASKVYWDGSTTGTVTETRRINVANGIGQLEWEKVDIHIITTYTPQPVLRWPDIEPDGIDDPNDFITLSPPIYPADPNAVISQLETLLVTDPNSAGIWNGFLELLKGEQE